MVKKIALFGATGNAGKELLKVLQADETASGPFVVVTRSSGEELQKSLDLDKDRFKFATFPENDFSKNNEGLVEEIKGADVAFVCIPLMMVYKAKEYVDPLADLLIKAEIKNVVKLGTGNPDKYGYGRCHLQAEQALKDKGLSLTVLNGGDYCANPQYLGPGPPGAPFVLIDLFKGMSYLSYLKDDVGLKTLGNCAAVFGNVKVPFLDLRDFAEAFKVVLMDPLKHTGKVYQICSEPSVSITDVAEVYSELLGRKLHVIYLNEKERKDLMTLAFGKLDDAMMETMLDMFREFEKGAFAADDSWDGLKVLTGKDGRTFRTYAKEQVAAKWKPIPLPW